MHHIPNQFQDANFCLQNFGVNDSANLAVCPYTACIRRPHYHSKFFRHKFGILELVEYIKILAALLFFAKSSFAVTLNSSQTDYVTSGNITTSGTGITSNLSGSSLSPDKITNRYVITTGNSGATSSAYGIKLSGNYNLITNDVGAVILTTGSSGRGISIVSFSSVENFGTITTQGGGTSSHGIYVGGDSNDVNNAGSISSAKSNGIYVVGNGNKITNSGTIVSGDGSSVYGIKIDGNNSSIVNSGNISSVNYAIYNSGSANVITDSGVLNGAVKLGNGTFNILGGSVRGNVEGLDSSGIINIGNDSNQTIFNQSASFLSLDTVSINSGSTLNSYSKIEANNILLGQGASLSLYPGSSLSGTISGASSSSFRVNPGSLFNVTDNLNVGNVVIAGEIAVDAGSKKINGNFFLLNGGVLSTALESHNVGNLLVSGLISIDTNSRLTLNTSSNRSYIADGSKFVLISGGSGSSVNAINDSNIKVSNCDSNICGLLKFHTMVENNNLVLTAERMDSRQAIKGENAQKAYQRINQIGEEARGKMREFQLFLDSKNFGQSELTQTVNQLLPQSSKANFTAGNNLMNSSLKVSETRIDNIRSGSSDVPARNFNYKFFENIFSQDQKNVQKFDIFNLQQQGGSLENGAWIQPFGSSATQDSVGDDYGYHANLAGVAFGIDHKISPSSVYGLSLSYARSEIKSFDSYKKNLISAYQINFYHSKGFDKFFTDSFFGFAVNEYSSNRAIPAVKATADAQYNGYGYFAKIRVGMEEKINRRLKFIPEMSANFLHSYVGSYKEKGADSLNLNVSSSSSDSVEGRVGAGLNWSQTVHGNTEFRKIDVTLKASYGYSFINKISDVQSSFADQNSSFNSQVPNLDRSSIKANIGVNLYHIDDVTFSTDYQMEHRPTYSSHFAALRVRQEF